MKKLEQIKQNKAWIESPDVKIEDHFSDSAASLSSELNRTNILKRSYFIKGFDIGLELAMKFEEWKAEEQITYYLYDVGIGFPNSYFKKDNHSMDIATPEELFDYWIENVYK